MPSSCRARMTRTATSPRFAMSTRENKLERVQRPGDRGLEVEERLPELHGLAVLDMDRPDEAFDVGLHLVHQLHRLEDAEGLARSDRVALFDERRRARLRRSVEGPDHRGFHANHPV